MLVIDDDEWVCRLLAVAMREAGFEITICENAADGFYRAVEEQPDCIVCDVDLPDHNGFWVARKVRAHPSRVSTIPLVFLSGLDDREHRLEGFQVGGDAYLSKPFRIDEVVAQVDAFIQMAARLRKTRATLASLPPPGAAMTGDLAQMSVSTVLTLLDLERRSGRLELKSEARRAALIVLSGNVVATTLDEVPHSPLLTIRTTMGWNSGKFSFTPSTETHSPEIELTPINALLMEAARLEDEARAEDDAVSSSARVASMLEVAARAGSTSPPLSVEPISSVAPISSIAPLSADPISIAPISSDETTRVPQAVERPPARPPVPPRSMTPQPMNRVPAPTGKAPGRPPLPPARSLTPQNATPAMSANSLPKPTGALSAPRVPSQPGPRTAFGALRSLSPSKPMRAVGMTTPSLGTPSVGTPGLGPSDPTPAMPAAAKLPAPATSEPEAAPSEIDTGWSIPPPSISDFLVDDEPKKPDQ